MPRTTGSVSRPRIDGGSIILEDRTENNERSILAKINHGYNVYVTINATRLIVSDVSIGLDASNVKGLSDVEHLQNAMTDAHKIVQYILVDSIPSKVFSRLAKLDGFKETAYLSDGSVIHPDMVVPDGFKKYQIPNSEYTTIAPDVDKAREKLAAQLMRDKLTEVLIAWLQSDSQLLDVTPTQAEKPLFCQDYADLLAVRESERDNAKAEAKRV
jgi:hypothetical protein